jgi:hypothetical protein
MLGDRDLSYWIAAQTRVDCRLWEVKLNSGLQLFLTIVGWALTTGSIPNTNRGLNI